MCDSYQLLGCFSKFRTVTTVGGWKLQRGQINVNASYLLLDRNPNTIQALVWL